MYSNTPISNDMVRSWCASIASYELSRAIKRFDDARANNLLSKYDSEVYSIKLEALYSMLVVLYGNPDEVC